MKEIRNFIKERIDNVNEFLHSYNSSIMLESLHDDEFLFGTYEDAYDEDNSLSEGCYYISKFDTIDYDYAHSYPVYQACIEERLNESLPSAELIEKLKLIDGILDAVNTKGNEYLITINYDDKFESDTENYKKFESLLNFFNYFISKKTNVKGFGNIMVLEARKPIKMNEYSLPYVYHITTKQRYEKIQKVGLCPKHHNKKSYHPSRIYVLSYEISGNKLLEYAIMLYKNLNNVVILKIDTEQFKQHRCEMNFYGDPQSNTKFKSMFTLESIPTNFISVYK